MALAPRRARRAAIAKLNLVLEVLDRRSDGYHNLRTIFQTISLADVLELEYAPGRNRRVSLECNVDIPDNLVLRAAETVMEASNARGDLRLRLRKRIPMGGGLGGGSTDAAAVLLAVPALTGRLLDWSRLLEIGSGLGSDVPFFLVGGTTLGLGRGTELYPLSQARAPHCLLVAPDVHVSTAEAYTALGRTLTSSLSSPRINISQSFALAMGAEVSAEEWAGSYSNDFEPVVFRRHPHLGAIKEKLNRAGARPALMTGSGAALFGLFASAEALARARRSFPEERVISVSFVSRARYHAMWWRQLANHIEGKTWPPRSRYAR